MIGMLKSMPLAAVIITLSHISMAHLPLGEKDGYAGIKWGTTKEDFIKSISHGKWEVDKVSDTIFGRKVVIKPKFDEENGLVSVEIEIIGKKKREELLKDFEFFEEKLKQKYGRPSYYSNSHIDRKGYPRTHMLLTSWSGTSTAIDHVFNIVEKSHKIRYSRQIIREKGDQSPSSANNGDMSKL